MSQGPRVEVGRRRALAVGRKEQGKARDGRGWGGDGKGAWWGRRRGAGWVRGGRGGGGGDAGI